MSSQNSPQSLLLWLCISSALHLCFCITEDYLWQGIQSLLRTHSKWQQKIAPYSKTASPASWLFKKISLLLGICFPNKTLSLLLHQGIPLNRAVIPRDKAFPLHGNEQATAVKHRLQQSSAVIKVMQSSFGLWLASLTNTNPVSRNWWHETLTMADKHQRDQQSGHMVCLWIFCYPTVMGRICLCWGRHFKPQNKSKIGVWPLRSEANRYCMYNM